MTSTVSVNLTPGDYRSLLHGCAELSDEGGWAVPVRLPQDPTVAPGLLAAARMPAGVRLELDTDAHELAWSVRTAAPQGARRSAAPFDVVVDERLVARRHIDGSGVVSTGDLGRGRKRVRIWLPQFGHVGLGHLWLSGGTEIGAVPRGVRWLAYGSSITHCTGADGPTETWPALVAAELGWSLHCLGFARECHLDPVIARVLRDSEADVISMCVGVNIHGAASFSRRTFAAALAGFLATVRDGHPRTPILLSTPIQAPAREEQPNAVGLTLSMVRKEIETTARLLRESGDHALHLLDGTRILGPDDASLLTDGVHPGPEGYRLMARRLAPQLATLRCQPPDGIEEPA